MCSSKGILKNAVCLEDMNLEQILDDSLNALVNYSSIESHNSLLLQTQSV
jgi:hypothetical protein